MSLAQTLVAPLLANMAALFLSATEKLLGAHFFSDLFSMVSNGDISTAGLKIFDTLKFESLSDLGSCLVVRILAYGVFAIQHLLVDVF